MGKYLDFHYGCLKSGKLPGKGLCSSLPEVVLFSTHHSEYGPGWYWGHGAMYQDWDKVPGWKQYLIERAYTPLRQNIVLFLAAINGEL